ncbi:transporter substrate-binding domain-containing protein [Limnohabitans sp.]|uniref:ABC transporter substrate-binding protein n=1 Tax=Limnohabitans sp. TaxID=1907725 RepID=UPI0025C58CB0|nr:transporter substrate-binding domain-containing protein [Limnohabitans sp.]
MSFVIVLRGLFMIDQPVYAGRRSMRRRNFLTVPLALCAPATALSVLAQTPELEGGVLRVGVLTHYKPFSFVEGQLQGFDVDVLKRLAAILKVELKIQPEGMANLQKKLITGEIAVIANQLLTTPENRRQFDFVRPYAANQLVCVQHEDDSRDFLSLDDLLGKKLGVLANTGVEEQARGALGKSVLAFASIDLAFKQLAEKKLDAVLEESLIADFYIERDGLPIKVTSPFAPPLSAGWVVRKGNKVLAQRLSEAVQTLLSDGSFKPISAKWFGYDVSRPSVSHTSLPR